MKNIVLVGGGGHCRSCIDVIELGGIYRIAGIVDVKEKIGENILSYSIFASDADLSELKKKFKYFLITVGSIGNPKKRIKLFNKLKNLGAEFPVIISPLAYVSKHANIGEGSIVMHQALINAGAKVGCNCIINSKALIEHDAVIEDHCHISTNAKINGGVIVQEGAFVGSGAVTKQYCIIPKNSFIKANSIVK